MGDTVVVEEATPAECVMIARGSIVKALRELDSVDSHEADHVRMYLNDALRWLHEDLARRFERFKPKHEARPPHPDTQIGKGPR